MKIGPFPKDILLQADGNLVRSWNVWMNQIQNLVNFGQPPSTDTEVTATEGIKLTNDLMRIKGAGGSPVNITANPQMSPGYDGQIVRIEGLDDVATVQINNGNGFVLAGGVAFVAGNNDLLIVHFNKAKNLWIENSRSNN